MNVPTIDMPKTEARERFLEYKRAVEERHDDELEVLMDGYRELARGRQLVQVDEAIRQGGVQLSVRLPRLAICRADARWCYAYVSGRAAVVFTMDHLRRDQGRNTRRRLRIPMEGIGEGPSQFAGWRTSVPIVPPGLRPRGKLSRYHILWEVEEGGWEKSKPPRPPGDPLLLKRVRGTLFAVVAMWDLTELERAIIAVRPT